MNHNATIRRSPRRRSYTLLLVLTLFALVTGLATLLTLHAGQFARGDQFRTVDAELRQLIDSGAAYAKLHSHSWPTPDTAGRESTADRIVLDATDLVRCSRPAQITLQPTFDSARHIDAVAITARITLPRNRHRSMTTRVVIASN